MKLKLYWQDLLDLVYPPLCMACDQRLFREEDQLCLACSFDLPRTDFEKFLENPVYRSFIGRFPLEYAAAWLHFEKGGKVQNLMHQFKYKDQPQLAVHLGRMLGEEWREASICKNIDLIIPVPLHPRKQRKRGYNQAAKIGEGLAEALDKPLVLDQLKRQVYRRSQTREHRFNRWSQVKSVFVLEKPEALKAKHILLIDDVVTTGATLEACLQAMTDIPDAKFSVLTLARA